MDWTTSTVLANATIESKVPSQLSDAALGGIIGGAVAGLILFLAVTIATVYFFHHQSASKRSLNPRVCHSRRLKLESPEEADNTFTYVKQVNLKDGNWTLPPGSTIAETSTLPISRSIHDQGHVGQNMSTTDRLILPEIACDDPGIGASFSPPEVLASGSAEAEVVEKQNQIRNCRSTPDVAKFDVSEPVSETGSRIELEPKAVSVTGSRVELDPKAVPETGSRDTQSVTSLNLSLSEDYCNRVIDEAFGAIDNFAYSDGLSDTD